MNALEVAINMELEGEAYYSRQAGIYKDSSLYTVCLSLAEDEADHARILRSKLDGMTYELKDDYASSDAKGIFHDLSDFKSDTAEHPDQLDFYRMAMDMEKQSIDLYERFLSEAADLQEKTLYEYLVKQEKRHYSVLSQLAVMLSHAEEWVEDADFGLRQKFWREY